MIAIAAAAPAAGVAVWSLQRTARDLVDPCTTWNVPSESVTLHLAANDSCRTRSAQTWSKAHAAAVAAAVPGGVLMAAVLAIAGAARRRKALLFAGGSWMLLETFVVFTIAPLTLLAGVTFLILTAHVENPA